MSWQRTERRKNQYYCARSSDSASEGDRLIVTMITVLCPPFTDTVGHIWTCAPGVNETPEKEICFALHPWFRRLFSAPHFFSSLPFWTRSMLTWYNAIFVPVSDGEERLKNVCIFVRWLWKSGMASKKSETFPTKLDKFVKSFGVTSMLLQDLYSTTSFMPCCST